MNQKKKPCEECGSRGTIHWKGCSRFHIKKFEKWPRKEKQPNGVWYAFYKDETGVTHRVSLRTRNSNEADVKYTRLLEKVSRGVLGFEANPKTYPFADAVQHYLDHGTAELSPSTLQRYREALNNHLKPYFKTISLRAINPKQVLEYIRQRRKAVAPYTLLKELNVLSAIFNFAIEEEIVTNNPVLAVRRKKPKARVVHPHYTPTEDELARIFENLFKGARRFFLAFANTGCRLSEISNANVGDANLTTGFLKVRRKGGKIDFLRMNPVLIDVINQELSEREDPKPGEPLFLNQYGTRYRKMRKALKTACENARVRHCTHHSLRHAYATIARQKGMDIGTISKLLGHANPTITQNIYIHWRDEEVHQAAERIQILQKSSKSGK